MELKQLDLFVIHPTLEYLGLSSLSARILLLSTIAHESHGIHLDQRLSSQDHTLGPAIGLYQIERPTHDLVLRWLDRNRSDLKAKVDSMRAAYPNDKHVQLASNLCYATGIARCLYYSIPAPLPAHDDIDGLWWYYKKHWNSMLGKATRQAWESAYNEMVAPLNLT